MAILMPNLTRAKNGDWFSRKVIPTDVRDAYQRAYGVRQEERFRRSDLSQGNAKAEFGQWLADVEGRIAALRSAQAGESQSLTHRELHVLVGRWYDWFIAQHAAHPQTAEVWDYHHEQYQNLVEAIGGVGDEQEDVPSWYRPRVLAKVIELSRLPSFLAEAGVKLDAASHDCLLDTLEPDLIAAMALLRRQSGGNFSVDTYRAKFPTSAPSILAGTKLAGWNVWDAFEAWVQERKPAAATINRWRGVFLHLNKFLDGRDVALVTDDDAVDWKNQLVGGKAGSRTINEVWLTAAHRIFGWVRSQKKISANPFDGVKVAVSKSGPTKGEFTEEDAEAILRATLIPRPPNTSPYQMSATRWVPWLCAYTGSRSGEMTQLRKGDIEQHAAGFWLLHIRPDAGTVKGNSGRTVVLHEHLIEQGFVEFVRKSKAGPLFYDAAVAKAQVVIDPMNPAARHVCAIAAEARLLGSQARRQ